MSRTSGKTQLTAMKRLGEFAEQGHTVSLDASATHATATITRGDGEGVAHHITITPSDLTRETRLAQPYHRHPQSVLLTHAIHAICDWSNDKDAAKPKWQCPTCATPEGVTAHFDMRTGKYDWYCPSCFYGEAA